MLSKKIILSVLIIGVVGTLAGSATWAYFSDTETNTGNSITAGTIDLLLNNSNDERHFALDHKDPGDYGNETFALENNGNLNGELDIAFSTITNTDGTGSTEYELGSGTGELGAEAQMIVFIDDDNDQQLSTSDIVLVPGTEVPTIVPSGAIDEATYFQDIDTYDSDDFNSVIATLTPIWIRLRSKTSKSVIFYAIPKQIQLENRYMWYSKLCIKFVNRCQKH